MVKLRFREGNKEDRSQESTSSSCHEKGQDVPLNGQYLDHLKLGTQGDLQASVDLGFLGWPPGSPCSPPSNTPCLPNATSYLCPRCLRKARCVPVPRTPRFLLEVDVKTLSRRVTSQTLCLLSSQKANLTSHAPPPQAYEP